jgi:hypothetical protein
MAAPFYLPSSHADDAAPGPAVHLRSASAECKFLRAQRAAAGNNPNLFAAITQTNSGAYLVGCTRTLIYATHVNS